MWESAVTRAMHSETPWRVVRPGKRRADPALEWPIGCSCATISETLTFRGSLATLGASPSVAEQTVQNRGAILTRAQPPRAPKRGVWCERIDDEGAGSIERMLVGFKTGLSKEGCQSLAECL